MPTRQPRRCTEVQLAALLEGVQVEELRGDAEVDVLDVVADSRAVTGGALFCCVPGAATDGHDHAADAVARGAVALLVERPLQVGAVEVQVPSTRLAMAPIAAAMHGRPSQQLDVIGVTGTNGKTTVTHLLGAILTGAGRPTAVLGTLSGERTTPEAPELQRQLARFVAEGMDAAAIEVSSHALDQHRVDATRFAVAVFTNLSRDHLDHHGSMEEYFRAKARLFRPDLAERAVVCTDDPHGRLLRDAADVPTTGYSARDATDVAVSLSGTTFTWRGQHVALPLLGRFNVLNALAALEAAVALGVDPAAAAAGASSTEPVPGRFERVDDGVGPAVVVDYAHTPDGLEKLLEAARELATGRVVVVFGCGGDRDRSKRPLMGAVASTHADRAVLTTDNPRTEDPAAIAAEVLAGVPGGAAVEAVADRRAAIAAAIDQAVAGDVVVIAGKGHEIHQLIGSDRVAFDDRVVAREVLAERKRSAS